MQIEFDVVIKPAELAGTSASAFVQPGDDDSSGEDSDDEPFEPTCTLRFALPNDYPGIFGLL